MDKDNYPLICQMPFLKKLTLRGVQTLKYLDENILQLSSLESLAFSDCMPQYSYEYADKNELEKDIQNLQVLSNMKNLKKLCFYGCTFPDYPNELSKIKTLEVLSLGANPVLKKGFDLSAFKNLNSFSYSGGSYYSSVLNYPKQEVLSSFFNGVIPNLETIYIDRWKIDYYPDIFSMIPNVKEIYMDYAGVKELPILFYKLEKLRKLSIIGCDNLKNRKKLKEIKSIKNLIEV